MFTPKIFKFKLSFYLTIALKILAIWVFSINPVNFSDWGPILLQRTGRAECPPVLQEILAFLEIKSLVAIANFPLAKAFSNVLALDNYGYADSEENCLTKTEGVFVAGDCRKKRIRQVATACADGATSALAACDYVDAL
jgi:hypothetical protein